MNLLSNICFHLKDKGFCRTFTIMGNRLYDFYFDFRYKTDTLSRVSLGDLNISGANKSRGSFYQPTMARSFNRLLNRVALPQEPVLVDFGCGKGRVLLLAALRGFKRVVGIEFSAELCEIARRNRIIVEKTVGRTLPVEVVEGDVADYRIEKDQNVFFFFNPFDDVILDAVVKDMERSLAEEHRPVVIFYYNPVHSHVLDRHFLLAQRLIIAGEEYLIYRNR